LGFERRTSRPAMLAPKKRNSIRKKKKKKSKPEGDRIKLGFPLKVRLMGVGTDGGGRGGDNRGGDGDLREEVGDLGVIALFWQLRH